MIVSAYMFTIIKAFTMLNNTCGTIKSIISHAFFTHFKEPIADGIGMWLKRLPLRALAGGRLLP